MALNRWSPMGELTSLHNAMDRLFGDFFGTPLVTSGEQAMTPTWYLPLDIVDQGNAYQIKAAVPGFSPDEVDVTYHDGLLNISAQHRQESTSKNEGGTYLRRELAIGNFSRSVQLPGEVRQDGIKASFDNGVLTIDVPKIPAAQPVKIQVTGKSSQKQMVGSGSQK